MITSHKEITAANVLAVVAYLLESPETSYWLKDRLKELEHRDIVDAWSDAEMLAAIASAKCLRGVL